MKVSLLMLTLDRFALTRDTLTNNIRNAENFCEMELLVADNGSKDREIAMWIAGHPLTKYHRRNRTNEGVAKAFNQLYLRATGDFICLLGNDLALPKGWLREMIGYAQGVPNSGIIGMDWGHGSLPPQTFQHGSHAHWLTPQLNRVFGVWVMRRAVIETLGFFHEGFDVYGIEDSDFSERVNRAGFNSCYVPSKNFKCDHLGVQAHDEGEYRKMKDASLQKNLGIFLDRMSKFTLNGLIEPLPEMRDPT